MLYNVRVSIFEFATGPLTCMSSTTSWYFVVADYNHNLFAGDGALLGAGVSVLGPIRVGAGTKVGAGSVVVKELPDFCVAVGVPARIIKQLHIRREPSIDMDQCDDFILDYVI